MRIERLVIDPERADHIAEHGVTAEEAREVVDGNFYVERTRWDRRLLIGRTRAGRYLTLIVGSRGEGVYGLVTARDASDAERRRYHRHRKG